MDKLYPSWLRLTILIGLILATWALVGLSIIGAMTVAKWAGWIG